jgi:hypothetical protein
MELKTPTKAGHADVRTVHPRPRPTDNPHQSRDLVRYPG